MHYFVIFYKDFFFFQVLQFADYPQDQTQQVITKQSWFLLYKLYQTLMTSNKQSNQRLNTLLSHYEVELSKENGLAQFCDKKLKDLQNRREYLQNLTSGRAMVISYQSYNLNHELSSSKSISNISNISVQFKNESKMNKQPEIQKASPRKKDEIVDFQVQYQTYAKNIAKSFQQFVLKQQQTTSKKPFQTGARKTASVIEKKLKASRLKSLSNRSNISPSKRLRTQNDIEVPKKEQICWDFGNNSLLEGEDEIVNNLLQKLKEQQEKYVEEVLTQTELIVKQKMKNYIDKQTQKNQEILFNLKQQVIDKSLKKLESNKSTIKNGYTQKMKKLVQRGLKNKSGLTEN